MSPKKDTPTTEDSSSPNWQNKTEAKAWLEKRFPGSSEKGSPLLQYLLSLVAVGLSSNGREEHLTGFELGKFIRAAGIKGAIRYPSALDRDVYYPEHTQPLDGPTTTVYATSKWAELAQSNPPKTGQSSKASRKTTANPIRKPSSSPAAAVSTKASPKPKSRSQKSKSAVPRGKREPVHTPGTSTRATRSKSKGTQLLQLDQKGHAKPI